MDWGPWHFLLLICEISFGAISGLASCPSAAFGSFVWIAVSQLRGPSGRTGASQLTVCRGYAYHRFLQFRGVSRLRRVRAWVQVAGRGALPQRMADVDVWQAARQGLLEDVQVRVDVSVNFVSPRCLCVWLCRVKTERAPVWGAGDSTHEEAQKCFQP